MRSHTNVPPRRRSATMSATHVALTAPLVRPTEVNDEALLVDACQTLHARFSAMWLYCPTCPPGRSRELARGLPAAEIRQPYRDPRHAPSTPEGGTSDPAGTERR